jgi:hypothetical protein
MPHRGRILLGFAVVPFAAALISMGSYDVFWHAGFLQEAAPIHSVDKAQFIFASVMLMAVPMTLIGAVPGVLWLHRNGWLTFGRLVALSAILGSVPFALINIWIIVSHLAGFVPITDTGLYKEGVSGFVVRIAQSVFAGAGSAIAFWLIAVAGTAGQPGRSSLPLNPL